MSDSRQVRARVLAFSRFQLQRPVRSSSTPDATPPACVKPTFKSQAPNRSAALLRAVDFAALVTNTSFILLLSLVTLSRKRGCGRMQISFVKLGLQKAPAPVHS